MRKRDNALLPLLIVFIVLPLVGCGGATSGEPPTPTPILTAAISAKPTYKVQVGRILDEMKFSARIAPVQEEQLFFRSDGRLGSLNVQQGSQVKKGDVLAELDMADILNQLAQADVTLQTAQLRLKAAEQSVKEQRIIVESALRSAQLRLAQSKTKDPAPSVAIAEGNLEKARIAVESAQAAYDRRGGAAANLGASREAADLQRATIDYEISQAQHELALQSQKVWEYDVKLLDEAVTVADANLQKLTAAVDPVLAQDVAKAQLSVDRLKAQVANGRIVAPFDGEVISVSGVPGRTVQAYRPVVALAAPGALEVSADLMSSSLQELSVGQECLLTMANYPSNVYRGIIRKLPGSIYSSTVQEEDRSTRISVMDANAPLERGGLVRVTVILQQKEDVLWVPPDALRTFGGKDFVLLLEGDAQRRVPVKVGIKTEDRVELISGVTEGQVVVGP